MVCALVGSIVVPGFTKTGTDLFVTDVGGEVVHVRQACVDYGGRVRTFGEEYWECAGIRVQQGVAKVTLMWNRVVKLALLPQTKGAINGTVRLSHNHKNMLFIILSEAKHLIISICYKFKILRLMPQNDILGQPAVPSFYLDRTITFEADATETVVLFYRPKPDLWWVDEYILTWR